ncbi:MAG: iron-sulfur cluster assembly scaffold protein [Bacteroidota bacterium]
MDDMRKEMLAALGYSEKAVGVLDSELHYGELRDPTVRLRYEAGCGDILILDLRIEDDIIRDAGFVFVGCSGLKSSASGLSEMIIGLHIDEAKKIDLHELVRWLEGIPQNKYDCAKMACAALGKAIAKHREEIRNLR